MRYLHNWLKEYYKTSDPLEKTAELITVLGSEVEEAGHLVSKLFSADQIIEAEITPNRGDLLSHFGLARDLSAETGKHIDKPEIEIKESEQKAGDNLQVEIKSDKCSLYIARVVKGVEIKESPDYLKERLTACGIKPVNNVVDVTNYVMLDLGHPLHAFDADKIEGQKIIVSEVDKEQEVTCLDDKARALLPEMLCIYDGKRSVAIAGVMGLKCSQIDNETTDIVLEAAVFDPKSVRKTSKLLNVKTEASYRFERGIDDRGTSYAIKKAAKMISEIAGGEILSGEVIAGEVKKQGNVKIEYQKINDLSGTIYSKNQVDKALKSLGFEINENYAYIPSWRHDIGLWQDLAEEVLRLEGLDKIKPEMLTEKGKPARGNYFKKEKIKDLLVEMGLDEAISYTFLSEADIETAKLKVENLLEVANPVQIENRYLRNSLVPGLLKVISKAPSFDDLEIFEMGHVFDKQNEWESLAIVTSGKSSRNIKKIIKDLSIKLNLPDEIFHIYELQRDELKKFKIKKPAVYIAEVDVCKLLDSAKFDDLEIKDEFETVKYRPTSKYPPVSRDMAFVLDEKYSLSEIRNTIINASDAVVLAEPFDEFIDDRFGKGKKSVAFHLYFQDIKKTMSDSEAEKELKKIINALEKKFEAKIRA